MSKYAFPASLGMILMNIDYGQSAISNSEKE